MKRVFHICCNLLILLVLFLTTACVGQKQINPSAVETTPSAVKKIENSINLTAPHPAEPQDTQAVKNQPTESPGLTTKQAPPPTPDTRLLAENWQKWPIIPSVSKRAIDIYQNGIKLGRNPHAFSVIGDCQSIPGVFMGKFGNSLGYQLKPGDEILQETINNFAGSFDRNGMAVQGGFTAASLLSPIQANQDFCTPGETPLSCEFRVQNPSLVIISLETWRDPATIGRYEGYVRCIIETSIERGTLPILMTKADMAETGTQYVINPVLAQLAYQYDIPLANFWLAAQSLENHGIDPQREGYHLSREGWNVKSYVGLQVIDAVVRSVTHPSEASNPQPQITASPTPIPPQEPEKNMVNINKITLPGCLKPHEGMCVLFTLSNSQDGNIQDKGIFLYDLKNQVIEQIAGEGYRLQDISPNHQDLLISNATNLYISHFDGSPSIQVTEQLFNLGPHTAAWLSDGKRIVFISNPEHENKVWLYDQVKAKSGQLSNPEAQPINIIKTDDPSKVYLQNGKCDQAHTCTTSGYSEMSTDGSARQELKGIKQLAVSPDNAFFAFMDPIYDGEFGFNNKLAVESILGRLPSRRLILFPTYKGYRIHTKLYNYYWSTDSNKLFILLDKYSKYYEQSAGYHVFIWDRLHGWLSEYDRIVGIMPGAIWSPDTHSVLMYFTEQNQTGKYKLSFNLLNTNTGEQTKLNPIPNLENLDYSFISSINWLQ